MSWVVHAPTTEELEYHDLLSLFEFLDNGDGEITLLRFDVTTQGRCEIETLLTWMFGTVMDVVDDVVSWSLLIAMFMDFLEVM